MKLYSTFDFQKNQAQNLVLHPLASAPSSPVVGQGYFDTATLQALWWNGSAWTNLATNASLLNGQNAAFYLSRANHTGTQLSATISDLATTVQGYSLSSFAVPAADVAFNSKKITGLADPASAQDAATKNYVDNTVQSAAAGIDSKPSVRVVTTANITLSGAQTIDSVSVIAGDRVLVRAQSTASQNGVYVCAAGAWSRAVDADATGELTPGAFWFVEEGTTNGKTQWRIENTGAITVGTTSITINQFGAAAGYTQGNGINITGNVITAVAASGGGLSVVSGGIQIDPAVVAQKKTFTVGDGSSASLTLTHNLNTQDVAVSVRLASTNEGIIVDWTATSVNAVTLTFASAPALNAIKAVVVG